MSTDYFFTEPVDFGEVLEEAGNLGLEIRRTPEAHARNAVVLSDGSNYVWVFKTRSGHAQLTRFGGNDETHIVARLQEALGAIQSEHEVGHWRDEISSRFGVKQED